MSVKKQYTSFEEMLQSSELPVLVDFYAPWCGPCQMMSPILQQVGATLKDKLVVVKINTDKNPQIAEAMQIRELPTMMLFKDGKPVERITGVRMSPDLIELVTPWL